MDNEDQEHMTLKWQSGNLSNFDYLMYLNRLDFLKLLNKKPKVSILLSTTTCVDSFYWILLCLLTIWNN